MKILHIINNLDTGGAERLLTEMIPYLTRCGHLITILLLKSTNSLFEQELKNNGVDVKTLSSSGSCNNPLMVLRLRKQMMGYDIIHAHLFPTQYWVAISSKLFGSKAILVTTEHNTYNNRAKYRLTTYIDRLIYGLYDGIICNSDGTKAYMQKRVPSHVKMTTILNGIIISSTQGPNHKREDVGKIETRKFKVLQVARFTKQKDQETLIRALLLLPENVEVYFAGEGETLDRCKELALQLGIEERVHFLGIVTDIDNLWEHVDLGVMSSHWEGFGLAAIEGMSHGVPVIASNVPGLAEVIPAKQLLFTPGDEKMLAEAIQDLYLHPEEKERLGMQCHESAKKYSIESMTQKYIEFYENLLKRN